MNKLLTLLLLLGISVSAVFLGCNKGTTNTTYTMKAKIGEEQYSTPNCAAVLVDNTLVIEGLNTSSPFPTYPYIAISIPRWHKATGPYILDSMLGNNNARYLTDPNTYKISMYGSLIINAISEETISGTFSFTTKDTTVFEKGTFTAKVFK